MEERESTLKRRENDDSNWRNTAERHCRAFHWRSFPARIDCQVQVSASTTYLLSVRVRAGESERKNAAVVCHRNKHFYDGVASRPMRKETEKRRLY